MNKKFADADMIYPPTVEQIQDLRTHNVGMAIRFASKLGRPLTDQEYETFRKEAKEKTYKLVELPNERFGIA
jgi:hypothetical protein